MHCCACNWWFWRIKQSLASMVFPTSLVSHRNQGLYACLLPGQGRRMRRLAGQPAVAGGAMPSLSGAFVPPAPA